VVITTLLTLALGTATTASVQAAPLTQDGSPAQGSPVPAATGLPAASAQPTPPPDAYEPNDTADTAAPIGIGTRIDKLSFSSATDYDYFAVDIKANQIGITITIDTYLQVGLDTRLRLMHPHGGIVAENDDITPTDPRSHLEVRVPSAGRYLLEVTHGGAGRPEYKTYSLETAWRVASVTPTATATVTPTAAPTSTPVPGTTPTPTATPSPPPWDTHEPNNTWEQAQEIAVGEPITELNFVCPDHSGCADNDLFRFALKGGVCYRVETADLAPGLDTNVIVYGPRWDQDAPLAGNDDAEPGAFHSAVHLCVPPAWGSTVGYVLVGNVGNRPPPAPAAERTYTLSVMVALPPTPTPQPVRTTAAPLMETPEEAPAVAGTAPESAAAPEPTVDPSAGTDPPSTDAAAAPVLDATVIPGVTVVELPPDAPAQGSTEAQRAAPLALQTCYDRNTNQFCDVDEGIAGLTVYVTDQGTGQLVGQALTDSRGLAQLTVRVNAQAELGVSVPYFAASQTTAASAPRLKPVMITTVAPVPALLP